MPQIDWNKAPKLARWWAVDKNGDATWFCEPNIQPFTDFWFTDSLPAPTFGYLGEWKTSREERPI